MSEIEVTVLDPNSPLSLLEGAAGVMKRVTAEYDPEMDPATAASVTADIRGNETFQRYALVASIDDEVVGLARMWMHNIEGNADKVEVIVEVDPEKRRRGVGTALLYSLLEECERIGRTSLICFGVDGEPNRSFWGGLGCRAGLVERLSRLRVERTDPEEMQRWVEGRTQRADDYTLVHWQGNTPPEHLTAVATLENGMNDAPIDELDLEDDVWTAEDVVALDDYYAESECLRWVSIVLDPHGSPAALSAITTNPHRPSFATQGDTVVLDEHRERGIGRWIKADMWQRVRRQAPEVIAIDTTNAVGNDPMLSINTGMGFERLIDYGYWQADVADLKQRIIDKS